MVKFNDELKFTKKTYYIAMIVALLIGIAGTHLLESSYYHHQLDKTAQGYFNKETNLGLDFNELMGQTYPKQIDCSIFRESTNISYCKAINEVRK